MKKFRNTLAIIMAVIMVASFTACAGNGKTDVVLPPERTQLIIGLDDSFAPMGFRDEKNQLVGFDIDLAKAVCEYLGWEAVFQPIDWDAKEMELNTGNIDCIWNGMSETPERRESMSLSTPYLNNQIIVMTAEGVTVETKEDLAKYNIGIQIKSAALEAVEADDIYDTIKDNIILLDNYDQVIMDMDAGRIDVMIVDEVYGEYKNNQRDNKFGVSSINFGDDLYVIGFRKDDIDLTKEVEDAIAALIANGKAAEISIKWFGRDIVIKQS